MDCCAIRARLGASALDTYHLMTTFPVNSVDDLRGHKILAPGPSAAWLEGTGAVSIVALIWTVSARAVGAPRGIKAMALARSSARTAARRHGSRSWACVRRISLPVAIRLARHRGTSVDGWDASVDSVHR